MFHVRLCGDFSPQPVFFRMEENFMDQTQFYLRHSFDAPDQIRFQS